MANILLLQKVEYKNCSALLHRFVDGICQRTKPLYSEFSTNLSLQEWWQLSTTYIDIFKNSVRESWAKDKLLDELAGLNDEYKSVVLDVVTSRHNDIRGQLLLDVHSLSEAFMSDMDWKMKLLTSSDKVCTIHEMLLSLDLQIKTDSGQETVSLELDCTQLDKLIASLDAANKILIQLK